MLWHALLWVPKLAFYLVQRLAVWTGTLYLFRKGKYDKVYYALSAALYITSWILLILIVRQTLKSPHFSHWFPTLKRVS